MRVFAADLTIIGNRIITVLFAIVCCISALWESAAGAQTVFAEQIDSNDFSRAVRGMHALGGNGDWIIGNGVLCATISAAEHETYLSPRGGVLIDIGHCGQADDLWNAVHPLFNMSKDQVMHFDNVRAEHDAMSASIIASGNSNGVASRNVYRVTSACIRAARWHRFRYR